MIRHGFEFKSGIAIFIFIYEGSLELALTVPFMTKKFFFSNKKVPIVFSLLDWIADVCSRDKLDKQQNLRKKIYYLLHRCSKIGVKV